MRLAHWAEHNDSHTRELLARAETARRSGRDDVHDEIKRAAEQMGGANRSLRAALEKMKGS